MRKSVLLSLLLVLPSISWAVDDVPWWKFWVDRQQEAGSDATVARHAPSLLFSEEERSRLREYLHARHRVAVDEHDDGDDDEGKHRNKKPKDKKHKDKQKPLPPGLQKKVARGGQLPPGWQKKVARGEVIDGDLYSQSQPLPYEWARGLHDPAGTETRVIGDRVFRIMRNTREILDTLGQ